MNIAPGRRRGLATPLKRCRRYVATARRSDGGGRGARDWPHGIPVETSERVNSASVAAIAAIAGVVVTQWNTSRSDKRRIAADERRFAKELAAESNRRAEERAWQSHTQLFAHRLGAYRELAHAVRRHRDASAALAVAVMDAPEDEAQQPDIIAAKAAVEQSAEQVAEALANVRVVASDHVEDAAFKARRLMDAMHEHQENWFRLHSDDPGSDAAYDAYQSSSRAFQKCLSGFMDAARRDLRGEPPPEPPGYPADT